jgi:hypothetical protein
MTATRFKVLMNLWTRICKKLKNNRYVNIKLSSISKKPLSSSYK